MVGICNAVFIDESTVNETCEKGCNSELKFTIEATGFGEDASAATKDCEDKCTVSFEERVQACGELCNVQIIPPPGIISAITRTKTCALCNDDAGAVIQECRKIVLDLQKGCNATCHSSTVLDIPGGFLVFASRTATETFKGDKSGCGRGISI